MKEINLIEILHPTMDILFVALNPPATSNRNGHYFSRNLSFWNLLYDAGLITQKVMSPLSGDDAVFRSNSINYKNAVFSITDLCHDVVETKSSKIKVNEERVKRILNLLKNHEVKILCLIHEKVGRAFENTTTVERSKNYCHIGSLGKVTVFEMPFHNASIANKHQKYQKLKAEL